MCNSLDWWSAQLKQQENFVWICFGCLVIVINLFRVGLDYSTDPNAIAHHTEYRVCRVCVYGFYDTNESIDSVFFFVDLPSSMSFLVHSGYSPPILSVFTCALCSHFAYKIKRYPYAHTACHIVFLHLI